MHLKYMKQETRVKIKINYLIIFSIKNGMKIAGSSKYEGFHFPFWFLFEDKLR